MDLGLPIDSYLEKYRYKYLALYHALRDAIINGMLPEGTRLPATRELAQLYGMSRGSAAQSYDMLLAEGYVKAIMGSGTYVARGASVSNNENEPANSGPVLSTWGQQVLNMMSTPSGQTEVSVESSTTRNELITFTGDRVDSGKFPYTEWKSYISYAANEAKEGICQVTSSAGHMELRRAIAVIFAV